MKTKAMGVTAMLLLSLVTSWAGAAGVAENVVGYNRIDVPVNSDVLVCVPFNRPSQGTYTVSSVTGTGVQVSEVMASGAYATLYYVRFTSGNASGRWSTITGNTANELVFEDTGFLSNVSANDTFEIYPHNTLESVFPSEMEGKMMEASIKHPTAPVIQTYKTQVRVFDGATTGINKATPITYYYYNNAWRKVGSSLTANYNNAVLRPGVYFIIRNQNSGNSLVFISSGNVPFETHAVELLSGTTDDVLASTGRPVAMKLSELNLGGTAAFADSIKHPTAPVIQTYGDKLLVFNNTGSTMNRAATTTYYYYNGAWRKVGASLTASFNNDMINPSEGFIIRKSTQGSGEHVWTSSVTYSN